MSQERRLMRRLSGGAGQVSPGLPRWTPQDEQDDRRNRLAERLLETGLEAVCPKVELGKGNLEDLFSNVARASLAASTVIYPDLPEARPPGIHFLDGREQSPVPWAAQSGVHSVSGPLAPTRRNGADDVEGEV